MHDPARHCHSQLCLGLRHAYRQEKSVQVSLISPSLCLYLSKKLNFKYTVVKIEQHIYIFQVLKNKQTNKKIRVDFVKQKKKNVTQTPPSFFLHLYSIVADNRKALMLAKNNCTEDEIEDIKRNVMAFEDTLGYLDCSDPYGFILGKDCRVAEAMECLEYLTMNMNETLSCEYVSLQFILRLFKSVKSIY